MSTFSKTILHWYSRNKRPLPWRNTRDPYKIWLSEIILQQTRVAQGLPYYHRFIENYPKVHQLAAASESEVLKLWQGLGYYSRARNLHFTAKTITANYDGQFPDSYKELLKLKGVGDYTASAISSICFNEARPVVDGNVYRVLARYFGVDLPINSSEGIRYFKKLAVEVMDATSIADYNQAIMEFGALQCTPQRPVCDQCPLNTGCMALQQAKIAMLPVKLKKNKVTIRYFNYLVFIDQQGYTKLNKRTGKGIWQHLYEFPLIETDSLQEEAKIYGDVSSMAGKIKDFVLWKEDPVIHKLSHQHLITRFWIVELQEDLRGGISLESLPQYPVPVLLAEFLETFKNSYFWPKSIS
ncbi:A/G-specific adenine glycosylase [Muriicola sp.]|uniref:A/G-specific adenine glycosylase n=1 Tax=Muriicola sp. TaxID=2020856 RepID=UPI003C75B862